MRASITPLANGALLFVLSFWLGECRSANNDFFDSVSVDHSPWQPITNNREPQRPSSPKFPPVRYANSNHGGSSPPQWHPGFNRHSTTEKFKDGDRIGPNNKPKFTPPLSVDGYKSYSPGPFFNPNKPDFFESQQPYNPFADDYRPPQDSNKRIPVYGVKPTKESPAPVYKESGEPPVLGPKLKPITPSSFDLPPELNPGPASFSPHPQIAYADGRKKVKLPAPTGSGVVFPNEKLNSLKANGRYPSLENDHNSVKDLPFNETGAWKDHVHEVQIGNGNKNRGQLKFHQNGVSIREVSSAEAPGSESSTLKNQNPKLGSGLRHPQNRTVTNSTRSEVRVGINSANELKPDFNKQTHVIYSNNAQLVEDGPPSSLTDNEEFHIKEFGSGNIIKQITSVRTREPTIKPLQVDSVRINNAEQSKSKPQFLPTQIFENVTEKFQPQNELANTVPILETVPNSNFDKTREPVSTSEETSSSEAKKKYPFRRPQLLSTTSTERPTTYEPPRRPTLKSSLKTRVNLNQSSKFRTTTELPTTITPASATESPVKVKNYKEDASAVQTNDIPLKPSIKPASDFNVRRRPVNRTSQNEVNLPPTGWALASFKNFTASRSTRRPATEPPVVGVTELPAKVKPFVAWSTRLQKMTTTESSNMDMTTLMCDPEEEMTTVAINTMKNTQVLSSTPSSHNTSKDLSYSSKVSDKIPSMNTTVSNKSVFSTEDLNNIRNSETNDNKSVNDDNDNKDNVSIDNDTASPDDDGSMTEEEVSSTENEGSTSHSGLSTHDSEKGMKKEEKVGISDATSFRNSTSSSKFPLLSKMKNEVSSSSKDTETDFDQDSETDAVESSVDDDANKPTEKLNGPSENDEIEFVEATNSSNAHGLYDSNDLKTKPVETIYLTDVKSGVVGLTSPVGPTFQQGKGSEILPVTNSSSLENFVNNTKNETHSTSSFNNVPHFSSTDSVPFSKNYQNNSSQSSNELNTENEFGILKGVSSQLDLGGRNKSRVDSTTNTVNKMKDLNENPTETDGLFEVSFDSPVDKTSPSTEGNFTPNVSEKVNHPPSTVSSISSSSNEEIPDFEFSTYKPQLSSELSENSSSSWSSNKFTTKSSVNGEEFDKTTMDPELGTRFKEADKLSTVNREKPISRIPNTTVSIQFVSPETETTVKSVERTNSPDGGSKSTGTTSKTDLGSKSSTTESVSVTSWAGPINFRTSTRVPSRRVEYTTPKTSAIPVTTISSTMKLSTSTKKHENIIPLVPDKFDENDATDDDVYIETDVDQDSTPTSSTKTVITTTKSPATNTSSEGSETDPCPSITQCRIPLHIQLRIEASQSELCKMEEKLKNSIIKLFRSGTARVRLPNQIRFIGSNFRECMKGDSAKMTDVNFYLADGIGDFEQSINEEFLELYRKMGLPDYEQKVESAHLVMNKDNDISVGPDMDHSKTRVIAAVVIICLALICLVLVILLLMIIRKRQKRFNYGQRCVPVTLDDYSLDNISVYNSVRRKGDARASKRSYGNPAFDDPNGPTHRMNFAGLAKFTSDQNAIDEEFASIPVVAVKPDELPPSAETKNRYANVIPLPETRVHLINTKSGGSSDYINANYVKGPKREEKFYIACQAPLQSTIEDFWRMIWEQQSKVILMLTDFFENGVEKCANYLPPSEVIDCNRVFGDFQVTLKKRENREKYIISSLQLKNLETNSWREVTHLWYTSWPPLGVPNEESSIIAFLIEARVYMKNNTGPNIIHCSPGTGRTGTVIACDLCIRDFEVTRMVDVPKCVYMLRRCRAGAVQTKQQYAFIYKVLNLYAAKLTGGGLDSI